MHPAPVEPRIKVLASRYALYSTILVVVAALLVLIGWQADITFFKHPFPATVSMNPITAAAFGLCGTALLIFLSNAANDQLKQAGGFMASLVVFIGLMRLIAIITGFDLAIDQLLYSTRMAADVIDNRPNRMAPNTAFNFMLLGLALHLLSYKKRTLSVTANYLALLVFIVGIFSITGYIYNLKQLYGVLTYIPMAVHTAVSFILASMALMLYNNDAGFMRTFTSPYSGGRIARILIPCIIVIPIALGYVWLQVYWRSITMELGVTLLITCIIIFFFALVWYVTQELDESDVARSSAEDKLKQYALQLEVKNKELEAFSYSVSHDLRAPLRAINGFMQIIIKEHGYRMDSEAHRLMNNVVNSARRMTQLIDDLLALSYMGKRELQKRNISMQELVAEAYQELLVHETRPDIDLQIRNLPNAEADASTMMQVWLNLIGNALKYTRNKPQVHIEIGSDHNNGEIIYYIKDNGAGFNMNFSNKLFGVFQRLHSQKEFEGTGVGLAIVEKIIARHGGRIWAEGKVDEGATFYFTVPN